MIAQSINIITKYQADSGAYLASPAFVHYRYAWLRDGAFTAYAMNRFGHHSSARRFHEWCDRVVQKHAGKAKAAIAAVKAGAGTSTGGNEHFLHTRYTVEGEEVPGEWGSYQLDGYGTWLWALAEHIQLCGETELIERFRPSIGLIIEYLDTCWRLPNFDCWEEAGDQVHPATLAAIYGGIKAMEGHLPEKAAELATLAQGIRSFVRKNAIVDGHFVKSLGNPAIDASLLWMALPFGLTSLDDPVMVRTVERIERELLVGCGVHRYVKDSYYGGGQWPLLSSWLGWYYARTGQRENASRIMEWVAAQCGDAGLPEQAQEHLLAPDQYQVWLERAGKPAVPLLWSHAMALVLAAELG